MQQMSRLGSMRRQLILLCCGSLLLIWSGVFASAWLDRQAEEAVSMKLADLYLEESSSRADAIFRGVHSYLRLAQAAGKLNVPFERLYEGMRAEYGNDSVIAHAVIFDRQDNIHYASSPLPVLPAALRGLTTPEGEFGYVAPYSLPQRKEAVFYVVGGIAADKTMAVAIKCAAFADFVSPGMALDFLQLSLANSQGQLFSSLNVDVLQFASLPPADEAERQPAWEELPSGEKMLVARGSLQAAPFTLRIALPQKMVLRPYYDRWRHLLFIGGAGSLVLVMLSLLGYRTIKTRHEAQQLVWAEKDRFQQLVENLREVFLICEAASRRLVYVSPSAAQVWGAPLAETDLALDALAAAFVEADRLRFVQVQKKLGKPGDNTDIECRLKRSDGELRWVRMRMSYVGRAPDADWIVGLIEDVTERKNLELALAKMATTDALTGLPNRVRLYERGEQERYRAVRYSHPLVALMIDIDHFKAVNDKYGHAAGDEVLARVAHTCSNVLRSTDLMARLGGEEFAVLLSETAVPAGIALAERLRQLVADQSVQTERGLLSVTVSVGVAGLQAEDTSFEAVLKRADAALYKAKAAGRNQVVVG